MQTGSLVAREKAPIAMLAALFAIFIVSLPRYTDTAKIWFVLLILSAAIYLISHPRELKLTDRPERFLFAAMLLNFQWMAFSFYVNGEPGRGDSFLWGRHFYFLFLIPMFFMFRQVKIPLQAIVFCLVASLLLSSGDIIIDLLKGQNYRIQGMNMNKFGPIQLCIVGLLACFFTCLDSQWKKWLVAIAMLIGLATVLLSESKATWAATVLVSIFFIFYLPTQWSPGRKVLALVIVVAIMASSYLLPVVESRVDKLSKNVAAYLASDHSLDRKRKGTFGTRMELWRAGWLIFREQPITGAGLGGFALKMKQNQVEYQLSNYVVKYKYVHNQYLTALVTRGIPGLILLLLVMLTPIYIAMQRKSDDRETQAACLGLLFIGVTYLVVNMPDDHFEGKSANMFLSVMLALLLARISTSKASNDTTTR